MALDLKRLDPALPVEAMGVVGDDDLGRFLIGECDAHGVERAGLRALAGRRDDERRRLQRTRERTAHAFLPSGRRGGDESRSFRLLLNAARAFSISGCRARMRRWTGRGAARRTAGPRCCARPGALRPSDQSRTHDDSGARLAELGRPCLPHLDTLIVNDFEIGALAGRETRGANGSTDVGAVSRAIDDALKLGAMRWVVAHFPEGAVARRPRRNAARARIGRDAGQRDRRRERRGRRLRRRA